VILGLLLLLPHNNLLLPFNFHFNCLNFLLHIISPPPHRLFSLYDWAYPLSLNFPMLSLSIMTFLLHPILIRIPRSPPKFNASLDISRNVDSSMLIIFEGLLNPLGSSFIATLL
jgi:hypothetical protein